MNTYNIGGVKKKQKRDNFIVKKTSAFLFFCTSTCKFVILRIIIIWDHDNYQELLWVTCNKIVAKILRIMICSNKIKRTLRERSKRLATGTFKQICIISKCYISISCDSPIERNLTSLILSKTIQAEC